MSLFLALIVDRIDATGQVHVHAFPSPSRGPLISKASWSLDLWFSSFSSFFFFFSLSLPSLYHFPLLRVSLWVGWDSPAFFCSLMALFKKNTMQDLQVIYCF